MKQLILTIEVKCLEGISVKGQDTLVTLLPFTGRAFGEHFSGQVLGNGVDTQKTDLKSGKCRLSARYMLEGTDSAGSSCRIFIENSIQDEDGWHPVLVTDSPVLAEWERIPLTASVEPADGGVTVRIYR